MDNMRGYLANSRQSVAKSYNASGAGLPVYGGNGGRNFGPVATNRRSLVGGGGNYAAAGSPQMQNQGVAPLFGIQVQNTTTSNFTGVDILGQFQYGSQAALFTSGNQTSVYSSGLAGYTTAGNVIVSTIFSNSGFNYQTFLTSIGTQQFRVGAIHVQVSTTGAFANQQAFDVINVTTASQSGGLNIQPVKQLLNPMQQQTGVTQNYLDFIIDGYTKLTLSNLYAGCTIQYSFLPQTTTNPSGALAGTGNAQGWSVPQL